MTPIPPLPDMRQPTALLNHVRSVLDFYDARAIDTSGGCLQFFKDDGAIYDWRRRHLVSSTRFVFLWAMASRHLGEPRYLDHARHALRFVRDVHRQPAGNYLWELDWDDGRATTVDDTQHGYGLAFVLLAYAHAVMAGLDEARPWLAETFDRLDALFWQAEHGAYADEATVAGVVAPYRGQNANMHLVEACLAAHEATGDARYLDRAATVAEIIVMRLSARTASGPGSTLGAVTDVGWIWEHYRADWSIDWHYNEGDASNLFRPWGYQPGHFTEWAHLLLTLEQRRPEPWHLPRARELFDAALRHGWDSAHGGLVYGFGPGGKVCFAEKYHWVQCETIAAAAMLGARTGDARYWQTYDQLWAYAWRHWVDHEHGAWYRILAPDNSKLTDEKSPAGKVDYHTTGACWRAIAALVLLDRDRRDPA
jgi:mannose/cellobiose epimerase-like protein (N-acyl-D-glucosamine 2-epimerase family)